MLLALPIVAATAAGSEPSGRATPLDTPPSALPLASFEAEVLYPWLEAREYVGLGWTVDSHVRDTGPFVQGHYYGSHPAVRLYYSPGVRDWIDGGREGRVPAGGIIVKEQFTPPAAIYRTLEESEWFQKHPERYQALLDRLLIGWSVMIKDPGGDSKDGWFWSSPGNPTTGPGNVDDYTHVLISAFGIGTCIRCHASAADENTFASSENFLPGGSPLQFEVDTSWQSAAYLGPVYTRIREFLVAEKLPDADREALLARLVLPREQRPWRDENVQAIAAFVSAHTPRAADPSSLATSARARTTAAPAFVAAFGRPHLAELKGDDILSFPWEYGDHVVPHPGVERGGADNPSTYLTSDNCYGCHGGLGGAPSGLSMFVQTGPGYGDGFDLSEYGEWRWSPMGLGGRDPIFHAQLESEQIILLKENGQLADGAPGSPEVQQTQQALTDTCLRCHGAPGLRQKGIDQGGDILNPRFDVDLFYVEDPLTTEQARSPFEPPPHQVDPPSGSSPQELQAQHDLGELARDGVSCTVCHHIAPPDAAEAARFVAANPGWFGSPDRRVWSDSFFYLLGRNTTGLYTRNEANALYGPFEDVLDKPMQNAMGITPQVAPVMHHGTPFISDSAMCGTCHTINLPNIGAPPGENPILTALEPNPRFQGISHSIEQATYLEWLNSSFGLGRDNVKGEGFRSCQDCHMPNRFATLDGAVSIDPLASQIASIQDSGDAQAEHQLPAADLTVPIRSDYRRHELVGLNAFLIEMFRQFPDILGVTEDDYETGAKTGARLAIENMLLSAREGRVATVSVSSARIAGGTLSVGVSVTNETGHRLPSGVSFRRVFLELLVLDESGDVIWGSGRTDAAGLIVDGRDRPLATELLDQKLPGARVAQYQPNHQTITREDQVQIYEELVTDASDDFTTSFIHRVHHIKDNRLPAKGAVDAATFAGRSPAAGIGDQGGLLYEFMKATEPEGASVLGGTGPNGERFAPDPDFTTWPATGNDQLRYAIPVDELRGVPARVRATLYSQAFMPAWFEDRFSLAEDARAAGYSTPETDRLFYIASRLGLQGTALEGWKLEVDADARSVRP